MLFHDRRLQELNKFQKCSRFWIAFIVAAGVLAPLFPVVPSITFGSGIACLFPGDNVLVTTANGLWCSGLTITSPTLGEPTATAYRVSADTVSPLKNRLNVTVALSGDLAIKLTSHGWDYMFYHLNPMTRVNMAACVAENVSGDVLLLVIQGEENLTMWKNTMDAEYSLLQKQISLDCAYETEYTIANDDTYYFVFYSESAVTVEANLTFQLYSYADPANSTSSCEPHNGDESCTIFLDPFAESQFLVTSSSSFGSSPSLNNSHDAFCIHWKHISSSITFMFIVLVPFLILSVFFLVVCLRICNPCTRTRLLIAIIVFLVALSTFCVSAMGYPMVLFRDASSGKELVTPGDSLILPFSSVVCSNITLSYLAPSVKATVYLLDEKPPLNAENSFQLNSTTYLYNGAGDGFNLTWVYHLNENSTYLMESFCLNAQGGNVYLFVFNSLGYDGWIYGSSKAPFDQYSLHDVNCVSATTPKNIVKEDMYYFVQFSNASQAPDAQVDAEATLVINFHRTEYTVSTAGNPNCTVNGHQTGLSCTTSAKGTHIGTKALLSVSYNLQSDFSQANTVIWECTVNTVFWIAIDLSFFVIAFLVFGLVLFPVYCCVASEIVPYQPLQQY